MNWAIAIIIIIIIIIIAINAFAWAIDKYWRNFLELNLQTKQNFTSGSGKHKKKNNCP